MRQLFYDLREEYVRSELSDTSGFGAQAFAFWWLLLPKVHFKPMIVPVISAILYGFSSIWLVNALT